MDHYFGKSSSLINVAGYQIGNTAYNRGEFFASKDKRFGDNTLKSWEFPSGAYGVISYNKAAIWLKTLEGIVGQNVMDQIVKSYFEKWKFKHPCRNDFIQVVNDVVRKNYGDKFGNDMSWFFNQTLYSNVLCDYEIVDIQELDIPAEMGLLSSLDSCEVKGNVGEGLKQFTIKLRRNEDMTLPFTVTYYLSNGEQKTISLDGNFYEKNIVIQTTHKLLKATIDEGELLHIDKNRINNTFILGSEAERDGSTLLLVSHRFAELIDYLTMIF
jgi:hypothetical protein